LHLTDEVAESKSTPISVSLERARDEAIYAADRRINAVWSPFIPWFFTQSVLAFPKVSDRISKIFNKDKRSEEHK
jgi:hypothetical protein